MPSGRVGAVQVMSVPCARPKQRKWKLCCRLWSAAAFMDSSRRARGRAGRRVPAAACSTVRSASHDVSIPGGHSPQHLPSHLPTTMKEIQTMHHPAQSPPCVPMEPPCAVQVSCVFPCPYQHLTCPSRRHTDVATGVYDVFSSCSCQCRRAAMKMEKANNEANNESSCAAIL